MAITKLQWADAYHCVSSRRVKIMLTDAIRLLLFPALMAFAASSDLFTMTISNRVAIALVGGFFALALVNGMSPGDMLSHVGAASAVLALPLSFSPVAGSAAVTPSLRRQPRSGSASAI